MIPLLLCFSPHSQMPVWWLVCFSKKHWLSHWNTYSWKTSQGSTIFSSSPGFFSDLPSPSLSIHLSSNSSGLNLNLSLFHSFIWSQSYQMLIECLSCARRYATSQQTPVNKTKISNFLEFYNLLWEVGIKGTWLNVKWNI